MAWLTASRRYWLLPWATLALALAVGAATRAEQERQYEGVRALYEADARLIGTLVRESAQQATWATGLVYELAAGGLADLAGLLGPAPREGACDAAAGRAADVVVWASGDDASTWGCFGAVPSEQQAPLVREVLAAADPALVDQGRARALGLYCAAFQAGVPTVLCRDSRSLDAMRREVGLGPLLAAWKGRSLGYVVLQDPAGILAATPSPGPVSAWRDDPELQRVLDGPGERSRLLHLGDEVVYETLGALQLGDGSRAVIRTGLDASGLVAVRARVDRRQLVMAGVLGVAILMSVGLAWALARADRRRREHREALRRRDEESRRWQTLGEMAATVAHEVRNPLNAIAMAVQRLQHEFEVGAADRDEFDGLLAIAADASRRVERVVSGFLDLGRPLVLSRQPHDVDLLVRQALASLTLRAAAEAKTLTIEALGPGEVNVDALRFGQVVQNLVANALDAVAAGGTVRVTGARDADGFTLRVDDDGEGMDAATLAAVERPFLTTRATGTGLGLPLARRLVEAHGGSLSLESTPGRGTRATVRLPLGSTP